MAPTGMSRCSGGDPPCFRFFYPTPDQKWIWPTIKLEKRKFYKYKVWYLNPIVHRHICSGLNFHGAIIPIVVQISTTTLLYGEVWDSSKPKQISNHFSSGGANRSLFRVLQPVQCREHKLGVIRQAWATRDSQRDMHAPSPVRTLPTRRLRGGRGRAFAPARRAQERPLAARS